MSGAGTSIPGPKKAFLANSIAKRLVTLSNSFSEYFLGSMQTPGKIANKQLVRNVFSTTKNSKLRTSLATTKRHVDTGTFVGHQGGQGLHLIGADVHRVTDATFARSPNKNHLINNR